MAENALASDVNAGLMEDAVGTAKLLTRPVMGTQAIELALYARQKETKIEPTTELAAYLHEEVGKQLSGIRQRLLGLEPKQRDVLEDYCQSSVPDFLLDVKDHVAGNDRNVSWIGWLGRRARSKKASAKTSWADWLGEGASDEQLLNFLQWHVAAIEKHQTDPEVQAEIEAQRSAYKSGVVKAVEEGWLHEDAMAAVKKVDGIAVYTGDIFDTLLQEMGGYHTRGTDYVIVAAPDDLSEDDDMDTKVWNMRRAAKHELNHALLGLFEWRWVDEAMTEHIAQALDNGEPEILAPAKRTADWRIYENERALMAAVLSEGSETIPVSLATQAYSETDSLKIPDTPFATNTSGENASVSFRLKVNGQQKRDMLMRRIDRSWHAKLGIEGPSISVIDRLNAHVIRLEHYYGIEGMTTMEARSRAAATALSDLLQQPEVIFGDPARSAEATSSISTSF